MAKANKKATAKTTAPVSADAEVVLRVYPVLDTLDHDGDRYVAGEEIELDPTSHTVAQLQEHKVIGAPIAVAVVDP